MVHPINWCIQNKSGLHVEPGGFHVDPSRAVSVAVITHGHADHAIRGHGTVIATPETLAVMECRYGKHFCKTRIELSLHEPFDLGPVSLTFFPAGHVLGSVQVQVKFGGSRLGVSGDYKCGGGDPTCADWEPMPCDVFITEATFALPVFSFPNPAHELGRLIESLRTQNDRPHLLEAYSFGKAQRIIRSLRELGYVEEIYVHDSILKMSAVYERFGLELGRLKNVHEFRQLAGCQDGQLIIAPSGAKLPRLDASILSVGASGWNNIRAHAKSRGSELPLVLSDHCDWLGLCQSIQQTGAKEVWVTHGRADALKTWGENNDIRVLALDNVWKGRS